MPQHRDFDRLKRVIRLRTGGKTFKEIGLELGRTKQRAMQLYAQAIEEWTVRNLEPPVSPPPVCPICDREWPEVHRNPLDAPPEAV